MTDKIEQVARAMWEADPLGRGYRGDWPAYVSQACAAIEAMREPTRLRCVHNELNCVCHTSWQVMIDVILKGEP
jgi:hypothetical protein